MKRVDDGKKIKGESQMDVSRLFYSNSLNVASSSYDFQLTFRALRSNSANELVVVEEIVVVVSPEHFKDILQVLNSNFSKWQERNETSASEGQQEP